LEDLRIDLPSRLSFFAKSLVLVAFDIKTPVWLLKITVAAQLLHLKLTFC